MEVSRKEAAKQAILDRIDVYVKVVKEELEKCGFQCEMKPDFIRITKGKGFTAAFSFKGDVKLNIHYSGILEIAVHDQELADKLTDALLIIEALNSAYLDGFDDTESDRIVREKELELNTAIGLYFACIEEEKKNSSSSIKQVYENMVADFNRSEFKYELIRDEVIEQKVGIGHGYRTKVTFLKGETRSGHRDTQYVFNHTMLMTDYVVLSNKTLEFAKASELTRDDVFGLLRFAYFDCAMSNAFNYGYVTDSDDDRCDLSTISHDVLKKACENEIVDKYFKEVIGNFRCTNPETVEINTLYDESK